MKLVSALLVVAALATSARAEEPSKRVSVTFSPVHLVFPIVELAGDVMVAPHMGATLILGGGRISNEEKTLTASAYEVGAQFNYYFLSAFDGLHAGAELLYVGVDDVDQDSTVTAAGLSVGPYVGYKLMTSIGFTFIAQGGIAYAAYKAESSTQTASDKKVYPLVNLNVGWSF